MERVKKIVSALLILCMTAGCFAFTETEKAEAGISTIDGTIYVYHLDNTYSNGKYRIREKIVHNRTDTNYDIPITIYNQYLTNSAGKKVLTWKNWDILKRGGTKEIYYAVDFSSLPSGTYTLHFSLSFGNTTASYSRKITHSAGKIKYSSSKYVYDTNGYKSLSITFNLVSLKGYSPKFEIFDSKGNRVFSKTYAKLGHNNSNFTITWGFSTNSGNIAKSGTYTFKLTCNGKACSKNLTIKN